MNPTEVDVCVSTYRLPDGLQRLLASLELQEPATRFRVIVVDNDAEETARPVAEAHWSFPVLYDVEPARGVSETRNRALRHATAEFVALVDDDEVADAHWLAALLDTVRNHQADVVFGTNILQLPSDTHPVKRHLLQLPGSPTGTQQETGPTSNVLLRRSILDRLPVWFEPQYGLTGSEDIMFFWRLGDGGARMVHCDEALTYEAYAAARVAWSWILPKLISSGQAFSARYTGGGPLQTLSWAGRAVVEALLIPWGALRGWSGLAYRLGQCLHHIGLASGAWGWRINLYSGARYWRNQGR